MPLPRNDCDAVVDPRALQVAQRSSRRWSLPSSWLGRSTLRQRIMSVILHPPRPRVATPRKLGLALRGSERVPVAIRGHTRRSPTPAAAGSSSRRDDVAQPRASSLMRPKSSLMPPFNSLLGRNKFPVPMRRELPRKVLISLCYLGPFPRSEPQIGQGILKERRVRS